MEKKKKKELKKEKKNSLVTAGAAEEDEAAWLLGLVGASPLRRAFALGSNNSGPFFVSELTPPLSAQNPRTMFFFILFPKITLAELN